MDDLARLRRRPPSPAKPATAWSRRSACGAEAESGGYGVAKARRVIGAAIDVHKAQVISYLKATGHHLGLLINFNEALLPDGLQRIILSG